MKALTYSTVIAAAVALAGCTVHQAQTPTLSGPSTLAFAPQISVVPDTVSQDGGSQAKVTVSIIGPDGRPVASQTFRVDMAINGVAQDFGTLSARTIVTNASGVATVTYTAPAPASGGAASGNTPSACASGLPGNCVQIVATPTGPPAVNDAQAAAPVTALIRLVPIGVILPPAETPTPAFTTNPGSPLANSPVVFDASASCSGPVDSQGHCLGQSAITSFSWDFGDGSTASGPVVTHSFRVANTYPVILTVTNSRGGAASKSVSVTVGLGNLPTAVITFSPSTPQINQLVFFDGSQSKAGTGHSIASYTWDFGDGKTGSGVITSHAYSAIGTYSVTLVVTDEAGQTATSAPASLPIGTSATTTGNPFAAFTFSPGSPVAPGTTVTFNASASTAASGSSIVMYQWEFDGDLTGGVKTKYQTTSPTFVYTFNQPTGTYAITLTVTDNIGRTGTAGSTMSVR